jgi:hypothetical protein
VDPDASVAESPGCNFSQDDDDDHPNMILIGRNDKFIVTVIVVVVVFAAWSLLSRSSLEFGMMTADNFQVARKRNGARFVATKGHDGRK